MIGRHQRCTHGKTCERKKHRLQHFLFGSSCIFVQLFYCRRNCPTCHKPHKHLIVRDASVVYGEPAAGGSNKEQAESPDTPYFFSNSISAHDPCFDVELFDCHCCAHVGWRSRPACRLSSQTRENRESVPTTLARTTLTPVAAVVRRGKSASGC